MPRFSDFLFCAKTCQISLFYFFHFSFWWNSFLIQPIHVEYLNVRLCSTAKHPEQDFWDNCADRISLRKRTTNYAAVAFADGVNERHLQQWLHKRTHPVNKLVNHKKERNVILNCDWPIRLLLTSYCLTFLYVPWA